MATIHVFRKSKRAQSDVDFETWLAESLSNTLNLWDVGEVRATNIVVVDGVPRRLTPGEWERLQGLAGGWAASAPETLRYMMIGDAVAVPLIAQVGQQVA